MHTGISSEAPSGVALWVSNTYAHTLQTQVTYAYAYMYIYRMYAYTQTYAYAYAYVYAYAYTYASHIPYEESVVAFRSGCDQCGALFSLSTL